MRLSQAWIITAKDFSTFRKKSNILYATFGAPLLLAIFLPAVIAFVEHRHTGSALRAMLDHTLPAFTFFWIILAGTIPATIASYTIVGEGASHKCGAEC